jgi:hypothetical protein
VARLRGAKNQGPTGIAFGDPPFGGQKVLGPTEICLIVLKTCGKRIFFCAIFSDAPRRQISEWPLKNKKLINRCARRVAA